MLVGRRKDREIAGMWLGMFLGPIGFVITLFLKDETMRACNRCGSSVKKSATKCKYCHSELVDIS